MRWVFQWNTAILTLCRKIRSKSAELWQEVWQEVHVAGTVYALIGDDLKWAFNSILGTRAFRLN